METNFVHAKEMASQYAMASESIREVFDKHDLLPPEDKTRAKELAVQTIDIIANRLIAQTHELTALSAFVDSVAGIVSRTMDGRNVSAELVHRFIRSKYGIQFDKRELLGIISKVNKHIH